jgi:mono/diheme cytochrome c family protein
MRAIRNLIGAIIILAGIGYAYAWRSSISPIDRPLATAFAADAIQAGAALAAIGNCTTCHTRDGAPAFSGGRPIETPFGTIHATNITPDPDTGIGRWPEAAFTRAVREGVSRDGHHLYPAFPYDHMAKTTDADIKSVYAFLMTRKAVAAKTPDNTLAFPYSMRPLLAGWKLAYFDAKPFTPDASKSPQWNRGGAPVPLR